MRSYPRNGPEAAARIVALVLIADGHLADAEALLVAAARQRWHGAHAARDKPAARPVHAA